MHPEAFAFVKAAVAVLAQPKHVLEIGSKDINSTAQRLVIRDLFKGSTKYTGIDLTAGPGVDVVADGATWSGDGKLFDLVISTETLEHAANAVVIVANAHKLLAPGGALLLTAAGEGRHPHSAVDGMLVLKPGEFYRNVTRSVLARWLQPFAVRLIDDTSTPRDIYALAIKGQP